MIRLYTHDGMLQDRLANKLFSLVLVLAFYRTPVAANTLDEERKNMMEEFWASLPMDEAKMVKVFSNPGWRHISEPDFSRLLVRLAALFTRTAQSIRELGELNREINETFHTDLSLTNGPMAQQLDFLQDLGHFSEYAITGLMIVGWQNRFSLTDEQARLIRDVGMSDCTVSEKTESHFGMPSGHPYYNWVATLGSEGAFSDSVLTELREIVYLAGKGRQRPKDRTPSLWNISLLLHLRYKGKTEEGLGFLRRRAQREGILLTGDDIEQMKKILVRLAERQEKRKQESPGWPSEEEGHGEEIEGQHD